jgi:hypothetical protein
MDTNVSEEPAVFIFRVKQSTLLKIEAEGSSNLRSKRLKITCNKWEI